MPIALRGGTRTFWRTWGSGPPQALLLHCSLAHSGVWDGLVRRLDIPAVAFDAPGHGQSGPLDQTLDYQVQCLRVTEDFLGREPMDVIGHSFGATVALRLAAERPQAVRRLVLIEPVLFAAARGAPVFESHVAAFRPFAEALQAGNPVLAAQRFTAMWGAGVAWDQMRVAQRQALVDQIHVIPAQNGSLFEDNAGMLAPGRLEAIAAPTLLLAGSASPAIVHAIQDVLQTRLRMTARQVVPDAGHMLPITHAAEVADAIAPFLSR
ncbi:MAG: alpha/beta hydrolase [Rhodobacter sp.]|nr:alpha/beta hydrolase [Rhodobacter sp.]